MDYGLHFVIMSEKYVMCFMMDFVVFLFSLVSKNMISKILMVK